jgi:hypothetical protein
VCAERAADLLAVVGLTGVAAVGVCLGRHRVMWSTGRTDGPVGAWMSTALRVGTTRPSSSAYARAVLADQCDPEPFLTVRVNDTAAGGRCAGRPRTEANRTRRHVARITSARRRDATVRGRILQMRRTCVSKPITNADLRITWASRAEDRCVGT